MTESSRNTPRQETGRIIELQRNQYTIAAPGGEVTAVLKGSFYRGIEASGDFPCVGDYVNFERNESGLSQITERLPRRTLFSRSDFSGHALGYAKTIREQVVAANFDYVFIMSSLNKDFKASRIQRYLTQAWQSGATPVVLLTKADLTPDCREQIAQVEEAAPGVAVHAISSHEKRGLDALDSYLRPGKTVVFLGMSGVGKSSLLNALMSEEVMAVSEIREDDSRGRHTTTHRQLFTLPSGAMVIDTPGMRELGLFGADEGISVGFADVEELLGGCRFSDCRHQTEPGCAVRAALESGELKAERWELYTSQKRENQYAADRAGYMTDKRALHKSITMSIRAGKKEGKIRK